MAIEPESEAEPRPCHDCPFRSDRRFFLLRNRVLGIEFSLQHDGSFPCHNRHERPCIGAISVYAKQTDDPFSSVWIRAAAACGFVVIPIAHGVPVYSSFREAADALDPNLREDSSVD